MQLYYWKSAQGNVGDDLNPWLWSRVFGDAFFDGDPRERLVAVGSVLDTRHETGPAERVIVFGTGLRSARTRPRDLARYDIRFVRGPRSAAVLGGVPYISDPAVLMPRFLPAQAAPVPGRIGFVPYFETPHDIVGDLADSHGLTVVSPHMEPEPFIAALTSCEYIIAEAMHGAILADSYRIPWMGCRITNALAEGRTSLFKWGDWMDSLGIRAGLSSSVPELAMWLPGRLRARFRDRAVAGAGAQLGRMLAEPRWTRSADDRLVRAQDRILEQAERLLRERAQAGQ